MYSINIEKETIKNKMYRKVLYTGKDMQLVVMSLKQGENIPLETHEGSQFVRIESGTGVLIVSNQKKLLKDGISFIIEPGEPHFIYQTGSDTLKLYSIYTPPEHPDGTRQMRM